MFRISHYTKFCKDYLYRMDTNSSTNTNSVTHSRTKLLDDTIILKTYLQHYIQVQIHQSNFSDHVVQFEKIFLKLEFNKIRCSGKGSYLLSILNSCHTWNYDI
jgi:hypothetical protein